MFLLSNLIRTFFFKYYILLFIRFEALSYKQKNVDTAKYIIKHNLACNINYKFILYVQQVLIEKKIVTRLNNQVKIFESYTILILVSNKIMKYNFKISIRALIYNRYLGINSILIHLILLNYKYKLLEIDNQVH